ncbi:MAG: exodeoxyribonuclease VII small subunit [Acidobacteriota bacterium]
MSDEEQQAAEEQTGGATTPDEEIPFGEALEQLEGILRGIESDEIDVDRLGEELRRATQLLEVCRGKIRRAEVEVRQIVDQLD